MRKSSQAVRAIDAQTGKTRPNPLAQGPLDGSTHVTAQLRRQKQMFGAALDAPAQPDVAGRDMVSLQRMVENEAASPGEEEHTPMQQMPLQRAPSDGTSSGGGLPDALRSGMEQASGMSLADVRVHRNSSAPARVGAHAYAQGRDIHLAPGQERHLPHEAWHVVQQAQGRVRPTMQAAGLAINDDPALEQEADEMGQRVMQQVATADPNAVEPASFSATPVAQRTMADVNEAQTTWNRYNATHANVGGIITADIGALTAAYAHYNGLAAPLTPAQADAANPFLRNSAVGLKHDVAEIDSHAGGYYFQQQVKAQLNAGRNIVNQHGAHGGASNALDPDITVQHGAGGAMDAHEVKRTTTDDGAKSMVEGALSQLSRRGGFRAGKAAVQVTSNAERVFIVNNLGTVQGWVINKMNTLRKGFALGYYDTVPVVGGVHRLIVSVRVNSGVAGHVGVIFDRDFSMTLTRVQRTRKLANGGQKKYWSFDGGYAALHATHV